MKSLLLAFLILTSVAAVPAAQRTPTEAHARLAAAVAAHDGAKLWNALDQDTRWSWMTIQRAWRECYDITQSAVPEGPERTRLLARFEPGATSEERANAFRQDAGARRLDHDAGAPDGGGIARSPSWPRREKPAEIATPQARSRVPQGAQPLLGLGVFRVRCARRTAQAHGQRRS
jgi:hypothetical protein